MTGFDSGTPKTKHLTTNVSVVVDDEAGTASARSNYAVTQATPDLPLQVIITGHYRDTFHVVDGEWWFDTRVMFEKFTAMERRPMLVYGMGIAGGVTQTSGPDWF